MTPLRSWLFIPGDSEKKLGKVDGCGADAVILDLEDAVAPANKDAARGLVADFLHARPGEQRKPQIWVRVNPLDTGMTLGDLVAVIGGAPDGIVQPKTGRARTMCARCRIISTRLEAQAGLEPGAIRILPVATETARAPFSAGRFRRCRAGTAGGPHLGGRRPLRRARRQRQSRARTGNGRSPTRWSDRSH